MTLKTDLLTDLDTMLDTGEFAVEATLESAAVINVIFHNEYDQVSLLGTDLESRDPYVDAKDSDITGLVQGNTMTIGGVAYNIVRIEPDGTGVSKVYLSKN